MNCPKCGEAAQLVEKKVKGRETRIDVCPSCEGMWFERNELDAVLDLPVLPLKVPPEAKPQRHLCPRCKAQLRAFCYPKSMVLIDMCERCKGLWLDRRELQEIKTVRETVLRVEPEAEKTVCPKCGYEQNPSAECGRCGIVFSKFKEASGEEDLHGEKAATSRETPGEGLKERWIRGIDSALTFFQDGIRRG